MSIKYLYFSCLKAYEEFYGQGIYDAGCAHKTNKPMRLNEFGLSTNLVTLLWDKQGCSKWRKSIRKSTEVLVGSFIRKYAIITKKPPSHCLLNQDIFREC